MEYKPGAEKDIFLVTGDSGKTYEVNIISKSCSCPQYRIRLKGNGTCKHYIFLINSLRGLPAFQNVNKQAQQLLKEIRKNGGFSNSDFKEGYEELIKQLVDDAEIYYDKRKHKYLVLE